MRVFPKYVIFFFFFYVSFVKLYINYNEKSPTYRTYDERTRGERSMCLEIAGARYC